MKPRGADSIPARRTAGNDRDANAARRGFTLVELSLSIAIISVLITISAFAFRKIAEGNVLAQAENAVLVYAKIARAYAVANQIETMMVVNPFNGRFEIWHLNPPAQGGGWSPQSNPNGVQPNHDGYRFAPVFDAGARLPLDGAGRPMAAVHPIDFDEPTYRPTNSGNVDQDIDNLTWAAFCFDPYGRLVIRTRRIATRTYTRRDGTARPASERNRLIDETPDMSVFHRPSPDDHMVDATDSPITSTPGFVISDATRLRQVVPDFDRDPGRLVNGWLRLTVPGAPYANFARKIVLNRFTGQALIQGAS